MKDAAVEFREVVRAFSAEIKGIPDTLLEVRRATSATASALEELIAVGSRAVSNLDVSVAAFRTTLDREFSTAARLHHQSGQVFAESVKQIATATESLASGAQDLTKIAQANEVAVQQIDDSIRQHIVSGDERFREDMKLLAAQVAASSKEVAALSSKVEALADEFDKVNSMLAPSISSFCEAIDHHSDSAVRQPR
jgi:hypothetical protein